MNKRTLLLAVLACLLAATWHSNAAHAQEGAASEWKVQALVAFVSQDLNRFWSQIFSNSRLAYRPPSVVAYTEAVTTACGRTQTHNAFYCSQSHGIYYHLDFLDGLLHEVGDFAVATVIAHEWGHAVQVQLRRISRFTIRTELQADCLAGAYAKYAEANGILETGDLGEGRQLLARLGDPPGTPRLSGGAHGSAAERVSAFETGHRLGINGCF